MSRKAVSVCIILISLTMIRLNVGLNVAPSPLCKPEIVDEMPPNIRKICLALENSDQLTSAFKSFINNEAAYVLPNYGKRTDVDHVFLRFGRKR